MRLLAVPCLKKPVNAPSGAVAQSPPPPQPPPPQPPPPSLPLSPPESPNPSVEPSTPESPKSPAQLTVLSPRVRASRQSGE